MCVCVCECVNVRVCALREEEISGRSPGFLEKMALRWTLKDSGVERSLAVSAQEEGNAEVAKWPGQMAHGPLFPGCGL